MGRFSGGFRWGRGKKGGGGQMEEGGEVVEEKDRGSGVAGKGS